MPNETSKYPVYILQETDEMRHPYENALTSLGNKITWFHKLEEVLDGTVTEEPLTLIVDLDCLRQPIEPQIEQLRTLYPNSDLIALSGSDSSQLALQCIRSGFSDFLLKPASPEELGYSLRKSQQRREFIQRLQDPRTEMVRAVTQISSCATPTLARLYGLEFIAKIFGAEGAAWLSSEPNAPEFSQILCAVPKRVDKAKILKELPAKNIKRNPKLPLVLKSANGKSRKVWLPSEATNEYGGILAWGISKAVTKQKLESANRILEHAKLCLLNIQKYEEVKHQTFVDDLTGLYNSRYLKYALTNSILRCKDPKQSFSVLFIDVDHFKRINDEHSHLVGSEFLVTIGKTIKNAVRRIDPVFRYGGDEFVVVLNDTGLEGAREIAERIRKNIERRIFVIKEKRIQTTVSIGLATYPEHASERETLLRMADEAMYSAKRETRNAVHLAVPLPAK